MVKLQFTAATFFDDGLTTTCVPTLATEGRPKSKAGAVEDVCCGLGVVLLLGKVGTPAVGLGVGVGVGIGVVVGVVVGSAGAVISVGVVVGVGCGVGMGVGSGVSVGVCNTSITVVGSGSFCRFALQDTTNTMIAITNSRQAPPTIRSLVRLSNCSMCVVLSCMSKAAHLRTGGFTLYLCDFYIIGFRAFSSIAPTRQRLRPRL